MRFLVICIAALMISACQTYSDNPMMDDIASQVKCPANACASAAPDANELSLSYIGRPMLYSSAGDLSVQIGGDCHASTFPQNEVLVNVYNKANNAAVAVSKAAINTDSAVRCTKGRYNYVLDTSALPSGLYRVRMELLAFDSGNAEYRSPAAITEVSISK